MRRRITATRNHRVGALSSSSHAVLLLVMLVQQTLVHDEWMALQLVQRVALTGRVALQRVALTGQRQRPSAAGIGHQVMVVVVVHRQLRHLLLLLLLLLLVLLLLLLLLLLLVVVLLLLLLTDVSDIAVRRRSGRRCRRKVTQRQRERTGLRVRRSGASVLGFRVPLQHGRRRDVSKRRLIVSRLYHSDADSDADPYADSDAQRGDLKRLLRRTGQISQLRMALVVDGRVRMMMLVRVRMRMVVMRRQT